MFIKRKNMSNFVYKEVDLFNGRKKINKEVAKENLFIFHDILVVNNVSYALMFGTLLGAIREGDFIVHDEDVDVCVLEEDKDNFLSILEQLDSAGLKVIRNKGYMMSIIKDDDYIDIYFFKKAKVLDVNKRVCGEFAYPSQFFEKPFREYSFLGKNLVIPNNPELLLEAIYSKDWQIPDEGFLHETSSVYWKYKRIIYLMSPEVVKKIWSYFKSKV